jgi:Asp-tRNA(Asn)/Glu-tRNA(Gln) amidotransferase A subunit family amidase
MVKSKHIPGQEYEFATVQAIENRIAHLDWLLSPSRAFQPPRAGELAVERDMLKYQWLGNAKIRARSER